MRRLDRAALLAVSGGFALWVGLTDTALLYIRPSARTWLTLAGGVLVVLGVALALLGRRGEETEPDGGHHHAPRRIGWLLVLPIAIAAIVGSNPLGSYAAGRQNAQRVLPPGEFDLEAYLNAGSFGGQAPALRMIDFVRASHNADERGLLADTSVRLTGFVVEDDLDGARPDDILLARFVLGCCAADALAMLVRVPLGDRAVIAPDQWIIVQGRLDLDASPPANTLTAPPVVAVDEIELTDQPDDVYEYPP